MDSFAYSRVKLAGHIINMTDEPINLYDETTGDIMTFYPNLRKWSQKKAIELFPIDAYYAVTGTGDAVATWLQVHHRNLAIVKDRQVGRGGVEITRLVSADKYHIIKFSKRS